MIASIQHWVLPHRYSYTALLLALVVNSSTTTWAQRIADFPTTERVRGLNPTKPITQYVYDVWGSDNGFQQTTVRTMYQTRDGYMWIGAAEGLVRFDGARFVTFDKSNLPLKSTDILALLEDRNGTFWIGTDNGLLRINQGTFTLYTMQNGLPDNVILALAEDKQGNVWIGTEHGLALWQQGRFASYGAENGLTSSTILSLAADPHDGIWIGTNGGGLNYWKNGTCTAFIAIEGQLRPYTKDEGLIGDGIHALVAAKDGTLWVGSAEGLFRIQNTTVTAFYNATNGLKKADIRSLALDREGTLWIATNGGGIYRLTSTGQLSSFTSQNGLRSDEVFSILEDREGSVWFGTDGGGIGRFKDRRFTTYTTKEGLSHNSVSVITEGADGAIYVGTNNGLNVFSRGVWSAITTQNGLLNNVITSLWSDHSGKLWIGTNAGLQSMKNGVWTAYTTSNGMPSNRIYVIYEDANKTLWIGTDNGLVKLSPQIASTPTRLSPSPSPSASSSTLTTYTTKHGLGNNTIYALLQDSKGTLWIGTRGGGLSTYKDNAFSSKYTIRDGLGSNYIWALYEDRDGILWVATGGGLSCIRNGKITTVTTYHGLFSNIIFSIQEDEAGWLWMSCTKGIFRVRKRSVLDVLERREKRISCIPYSVIDGLKSNICNGGSQPSVWKSGDGRFWYPTMKGAAVVEPLTIPYNPLPPTVIIERVIADRSFLRLPGVSAFQYTDASTQESFRPDSSTVIVAGDTSTVPELPPTIEKFEIQYTATSLLMPERVQFKFMLEGFDNDWVDAGTRRSAFYTSLPRGRYYRFRVMASNNDGVWSEGDAATMFYLKPYFYETPWFIALCVVATGAASFGFYRLRLRRIQKRNEELERIVLERTEEVRRQAKEIERANTELQEKNERLSVVSRIGRELTSSLTMETIITTVYQRLYEVMDTTIFAIGLHRPWKGTIEYTVTIDKGMRLPYYERDMSDTNQFPVWCIENNKEIIINDVDMEASAYIPDFRKTINPFEGLTPEIDADYAKSLIYMPLTVRGDVIGTLSVQSYKKYAYTTNHVEILRTLANYVAIAITNAEQFEELQRKQRIIMEFNKHITDSINYAKRIQTAMLPDASHIGQALSDYFILFRPRDVVSGDFYWYCDKDDHIYIAAVDCTGHGVPGAFMSLIGNSLLNEVVNTHGTPKPGTLLSELHKGVQRALRQRETNNRDGMDITLCMIDKQRRIVEFAGAMNSLYVMKNGTFVELKADKKPIGGTEADERVFTNQTIDLNDTPPGKTMLYLTSDGFKDQFGGDKGKKFSSKRFIEILHHIHMLPVQEQKAYLDATMDEWMGTQYKQIDDMLVIGVRL
ncbi:MAG: two-component regulator propeller domain-containing protein [Bacteroidota bacterium]|nr:SpoIIE family protein phosphatase [Candidatus Kapabacteria bacterium]MDW8220260.1 two-component regulator propeller domain-containing protein [Bacteroidota bacterium]